MSTDTLDTLPDLQLDETFAIEVAQLTPMWHVMKRGLFYRPKAAGYTSVESEAGLFTKAEAKQHEYLHDEPVTIRRAPWKRYSGDEREVMPWLSKTMVEINHMHREKIGWQWEVKVWKEDSSSFFPHEAESPTLARAACIALIRRKRASKD